MSKKIMLAIGVRTLIAVMIGGVFVWLFCGSIPWMIFGAVVGVALGLRRTQSPLKEAKVENPCPYKIEQRGLR